MSNMVVFKKKCIQFFRDFYLEVTFRKAAINTLGVKAEMFSLKD